MNQMVRRGMIVAVATIIALIPVTVLMGNVLRSAGADDFSSRLIFVVVGVTIGSAVAQATNAWVNADLYENDR